MSIENEFIIQSLSKQGLKPIRPRKLSEKELLRKRVVGRGLNLIANGATYVEAAKRLGINTNTFMDWLNKDVHSLSSDEDLALYREIQYRRYLDWYKVAVENKELNRERSEVLGANGEYFGPEPSMSMNEAADKALKVLAGINKLYGLDREVSSAKSKEEEVSASIEDSIRALIERNAIQLENNQVLMERASKPKQLEIQEAEIIEDN